MVIFTILTFKREFKCIKHLLFIVTESNFDYILTISVSFTLPSYFFMMLIGCLLLPFRELPLAFLVSRSRGDKLPPLMFVWESLYLLHF